MGLNKRVNILKFGGASVLTWKEGNTNMECGKGRINSVGVKWNWRNQFKFMISYGCLFPGPVH